MCHTFHHNHISYGSIFGERDLLAIDHNHIGFILELYSKYEIISRHVAKGYVLQCFSSSRDSSTLCFNILRYLVISQPYVQYRPLCPIYAKICQYPKISLLLALIKRYVDKNQIYMIFYVKF